MAPLPPYPPPSYSCKTEGYVVGETRFDDFAAAEAHSAEKKRKLVEYQEKEKARIAANTTKYKELRAAGKRFEGKLCTMKHGVMTADEIDAALADGKDIEFLFDPAMNVLD